MPHRSDLVDDLAAAMTPHLGAAVARERACNLTQCVMGALPMNELDVAVSVSHCAPAARIYGERVPSGLDVLRAAVAACEVLRRHHDAHPWLVLDASEAAA